MLQHGLLSLVSNLVISNDSSRLSRSRRAIDGVGGRVKEWCYSKGWCDVRVRKSAGQLWGAGPGRGDELLRCDVSILSLSLPDPPATAAASDSPPCGPAQSPSCKSARGPPQPGQTGALSTLSGGYVDASVWQGESTAFISIIVLTFLSEASWFWETRDISSLSISIICIIVNSKIKNNNNNKRYKAMKLIHVFVRK